jgi:flagellar biosynthetic protein FlhB
MSDSEDRTQPASKLREQQARDRGQVAHSPELTGAVALLAGSILLGAFCEPLATALIKMMRSPWSGDLTVSIDAREVVDQLRNMIFHVLAPFIAILLGLVGAGVLAHQAQVGGLWTPALMAPNLGRLWSGAGRGLAERAGRGAWILGKTIVVLAVAIWAIRSRLDELTWMGTLETASLGRAWCEALRSLLLTMSVAACLLGLIDFAMQRMRFTGMMRLTPEEAREDQKAMDGDPSLKGRRRRQARALRGDAPELMVGATLIVTGPNGLTVVLGGGPPPRRVNIRSAATGPTGQSMRRAAQSARIAMLENTDLAMKLARLSSKPNENLSPSLVAELSAFWPANA